MIFTYGRASLRTEQRRLAAKSLICSQVLLIPNCFEKTDRFPFNYTATVNTSFYLKSFRYKGLLKCPMFAT